MLGTVTDIHERKLSEMRLAEREKQLKLFVENAPVAIAMFDTKMRYVSVSRRFMVDRKLEGELTGRSHYELFPNLPEHWLEFHRRVLNGEEMAADEDYFQQPDGSSEWTRWSMKPWRRDDGSIGGALLMAENVTAQVQARRRLAESEAKFRAAFENAAVGVAQTSPIGEFILLNKRFCDFTGFSEAELLAKRFHDITHPDDLAAQEAHTRRLLDGSADSYAMEKRYIRGDGSIAWVTLTVGCIRKADGTANSFIGVINDITERKKTEAALRESKELLHNCLNAASAGVWDWDIKSGAVTWSPENYNLYARDPSDGPLSYLAWISCVHPEDRDRTDAAVKEAVGGTSSNFRIEFRILRPDGSIRWLVALGQVERCCDGMPLRMSGINLDISELKQAEHALRQSQELFEGLANTLPGVVFVTNPDGENVYTNPYYQALTGLSPRELLGDGWLNTLHPDDRERAAAAWNHAHLTCTPYELEFRFRRHDGAYRWFLTRALPQRESDTSAVTRWVGVSLDIHDRKEAEEQVRESQERLRYALKAASAGTWQWDLQSGKAEWSPEDYALYGRDPDDGPVTYEFWQACLHPDDREQARLAVEKALSGDVPEYRTEFRVVRRDGSVRWLMALGLVERAADGRPLRMSGINIDISERKEAEDALRHSEEQFRGVFEHAGTGIAITDMSGRFLTCNPAYEKFIGYTREELRQLNFQDLMHPADREESMARIGKLLRQEIPSFEIVNRYSGKCGEPLWIHKHVSLFKDANGKPANIIALVTDMTESRHAEERLRESEERLESALRAGNLGVYDYDPQTQQIKWDRTLRRIWGIKDDEPVTYDTFLSGLHPDDMAATDTAVRRSLDPSGEGHFESEYRVINRIDGTVRWIVADGDASFDGVTPTRLVGIVQDITERKLAEEALRRSEEKFRGVFENAGNGIAITNMQGQFVSCNAAYAAMVGYSEEELRTLTFADLIHPDDRSENLAFSRRLAQQELANFEIENRYIAKDGRTVWVHKHASLVRGSAGKPTKMIALITDITERKRQEEQISLLMREVNHRSKNILTLVQAIARQTAASQPADFLRRFDERVRALAASQDLLVKSEWTGADLAQLIRSQLAHFKDSVDARIALNGPNLFVTAPAAQALGMALHELSTNAGKYGALSNANGRIRVDWTLERGGSEDMFVMSWRERGGPPVQEPEIKGFGTTVICRMAERSLGAKVELLYERDGVSWQLKCPANEVVDRMRSPAVQSSKPGPQDAAGSRPKILVVEDEALVALEIEDVLRNADFEVVGPAKSVAQALKLLNASKCDAAVLDIRLGNDTSQPIAESLLNRRIPFVTLSGYSKEQRPPAFDGIVALMKPLEAELLVAQLKHCIDKHTEA